MAVSISPLKNYSGFIGKNREGKNKQTFLNALPNILGTWDFTNTFRLCHFLAQTAHETSDFYYEEEIASGAKYNGRRDLGNTQPGDGTLFKGRGFIQLTGRSNYTRFQKSVGADFTSSLTAARRLLEPQYLWSSAGWYLKVTRPKFYKVADTGFNSNSITTISKFVNGGTNGLQDRFKKTNYFASLFGQTNQTVTAPISATNPIATPVVSTTTSTTQVTNNGATQPAAASAGCSDLSKEDGKLKANEGPEGAGDVDFDPVPPPKRDIPIRSDGGLNHRFYQKPSKDGLPATLEEMVNKKNRWYKRYWAYRPNEGLGFGSEKFETTITQNSKNLISSVIPYWPPIEQSATGSATGSKDSMEPKATVNGSWKNLISGQAAIKSVWDVPILLNTYDVGVFNQNIGYVFEAGNELHMTILPEKTIINRGKGIGIGTGTNIITTEKANKDASWQYWPKWDGIWVKHCLNTAGYTLYAGIDISVDQYHQTILAGGKGGGKLVNIPGYEEVVVRDDTSGTSGTSGTNGTSGISGLSTNAQNKKIANKKEVKEKDWSWKEMSADSKQDGIFKPSKLWYQPKYLNTGEKFQDGDIAIFISDYHFTKDGKFTLNGDKLLKKVLDLKWKMAVISTIPHHTSQSVKCRAEVLAYLDETGKIITIGGDTKPYKGDSTAEVGSHIAVKVTTIHEIAGLQSDSWINGAVAISRVKSTPTDDQREGGLSSKFYISEIMQKYIDEIDKQPEKLTGRLFNFIRDHIRSKPRPKVDAGSGGSTGAVALGSSQPPPNIVIPAGQKSFKNGTNVYGQSLSWILVLWSQVLSKYQVTTGAKKGQILFKDLAIGNLGQSRNLDEITGPVLPGRSASSLHGSQLGQDMTFHYPGYPSVLTGILPKGNIPGLLPFPTYKTSKGTEVKNYCTDQSGVKPYGANNPPCTGAGMFFSDYGQELYNIKLNVARNPKKFIDMYGFPATSADKKNGKPSLPSFGLHAIAWGQDVFGKGNYPDKWDLGSGTGGKNGNEHGWREWCHLQAPDNVQVQLWGSFTADLWATGKWKPADMIDGTARAKFYRIKNGK